MESPEEAKFGVILTLFVVVLILFASFYAPCGCYAGTAVKDVPLRCIEEKR